MQCLCEQEMIERIAMPNRQAFQCQQMRIIKRKQVKTKFGQAGKYVAGADLELAYALLDGRLPK